MKIFAVLMTAFALAACGKGEVKSASAVPITVIQPVAVGVDAPCVPKSLGPQPVYVDTREALLAAEDAAVRLQLLYAGRAQRIARANEVEPIIAACPREK